MGEENHKSTSDTTLSSAPSAPAASDRASLAGTRLADRYEIVSLLGSGAMGSVYCARDVELDELVALKFLNRSLLAQEGMLERFRREVKLARRVTHVNVARTFDIGEHGGDRFLTMEFLDGESLGRALSARGALTPWRAIDVGLALCAGLAAAHAVGVVHRDLKPDNVIVERTGRVVITDFGIARAHAQDASLTGGAILGTPTYMAPEQVEGAELDGRADLYALGAVLYELLTGQRAWEGRLALAVLAARLVNPPPDPRARNPRISNALAGVVLRCMARRPDDRYATADEVADALRGAREGLPTTEAVRVTASPLPPVQRDIPDTRVGDKTVAVIPFRNGGSGEDDYVAAEFTEELVDALSVTPGLRVRPNNLVARHATPGADPREVGRALDVQVMVEGSLRRRAGVVRVTARLISVVDGFQLWAARFDRPEGDLLTVNDEVAHAIAAALSTVATAPVRPAPTDPRAVDLYLRARHALRHAWTGFGDIQRAVELFEQGLALAPDDPGLLSGYGMARARRLNYTRQGTVGEPAATLAVIDRATALAPRLGEPHLALASLRYSTSDWVGAVGSLLRAIALTPGLLRAHTMLATIQLEVGLIDEAIARFETTLALDPTVASPRWELARAHALLGRWDRVDALLAEPLTHDADRQNGSVVVTRFDFWRGIVRDDGVAAMTKYLHALTLTRAAPADAIAQLERTLSSAVVGSRFRPLLLQVLTELPAGVSDRAQTLAALRRAVDADLFDLSWLDRCPLLNFIRADEEFLALRRTVAARVRPIVEALSARSPQR